MCRIHETGTFTINFDRRWNIWKRIVWNGWSDCTSMTFFAETAWLRGLGLKSGSHLLPKGCWMRAARSPVPFVTRCNAPRSLFLFDAAGTGPWKSTSCAKHLKTGPFFRHKCCGDKRRRFQTVLVTTGNVEHCTHKSHTTEMVATFFAKHAKSDRPASGIFTGSVMNHVSFISQVMRDWWSTWWSRYSRGTRNVVRVSGFFYTTNRWRCTRIWFMIYGERLIYRFIISKFTWKADVDAIQQSLLPHGHWMPKYAQVDDPSATRLSVYSVGQ